MSLMRCDFCREMIDTDYIEMELVIDGEDELLYCTECYNEHLEEQKRTIECYEFNKKLYIDVEELDQEVFDYLSQQYGFPSDESVASYVEDLEKIVFEPQYFNGRLTQTALAQALMYASINGLELIE